jgi:molybdenum cofactor cytidylyltransferase
VIAGVVLAAGLSRRMGRAKLTLDLDGQPVIRHVVEALTGAGIEDLVVVVPPASSALEAALAGLPVRFAINPMPEAGQAGSVVAGVRALSPAAEAAVVALGDQPHVPRAVLVGLCEAHRATRLPIVAPRYREGRGNPVLFGAAMFPELLRLTGDQGARGVIDADPTRVALVPFDLPMPRDLDTPDDYESVRARR